MPLKGLPAHGQQSTKTWTKSLTNYKNNNKKDENNT